MVRGLRAGSVRIADFDAAVLRSVAGIEKKRSILQGVEKSTVAKHEAGHALLSTAIAAIIPGSPQVEKLSIIPRSGGALGWVSLSICFNPLRMDRLSFCVNDGPSLSMMPL